MTSNNPYIYPYVLNNPLRFVDPSGYRPVGIFEEETRMTTGSYNSAGSGWNPFGWITGSTGISYGADPYGGWTYSYSGRSYINNRTGETKSPGDWNNEVAPVYHHHTLYGNDAVKAGSYLLGYSSTMLGRDPIGNERHLITAPNGALKIRDYAFWEITGSYYNHKYFMSGVEAFGDVDFFMRLIASRLNISAIIPAAISWEFNGSAEYFGAVTTSPLGLILALRGQNAGSIKSFKSGGLGFALGAGASSQLIKMRYHYFGAIENFSLENTFYGRSYDFEFSAGYYGFVAGSNISLMFNSRHPGEFLIGVGANAGFGTPGISGTGTVQGTSRW